MALMEIRPFQPEDESAVVSLWRACDLVRPWNDPHRDVCRKLKVNPEWFLVGVTDGQVVATVMAGYEGHRGWLNYLAVAPELQRHGLARAIVAKAEKLLRGAGCPKINLQIRTSNRGVIEFYRRLGYSVDDVVSMGKRLERDGTSEAQSKLAAVGNALSFRGAWSVWGQDDNGNRYEMARGLTRDAAEKRAREFEEKGHKQTYWVEPTQKA